MSGRTSGWITGRSQIAFIVGLFLAFGLIIWLELLRFERTADPLGSLWIEAPTMPGRPAAEAAAPEQLAAGRDALAAVLAAADPADDRAALLLGYAACRVAAADCADRLEPLAAAALAAAAEAPAAWDGGLQAPLEFLSLTALLQAGGAEALPAWHAAVPREDAGLPAAPGIRQFAARALALSGREAPGDRAYGELRDRLHAADAFTRMGEEISGDLALGLAALAAAFPGEDPARALAWRAWAEWPWERSEAPLPLLALWRGLFDEPAIAPLLDRRLQALGDVEPLEAAFGLLGLTAAERGSLLATAGGR